MITLIKKTIEKVEFELIVNETIPDDRIGGSPLLYINNEAHTVYPVDTLQVIKAIANSNNMIHVKKGIKGIWNEGNIKKTIIRLEKELGYIKS